MAAKSNRLAAIISVLNEVAKNDERWGPEHDDGHSPYEWQSFIHRWNWNEFEESKTFQERMVAVAALAIGALEAIERRGSSLQGVTK